MNNRSAQNSVNAIVFKLQVILLMMEVSENPKVANTHLAIEIDIQVTHHVVAMEKVAE